jgi:hypothetical protein
VTTAIAREMVGFIWAIAPSLNQRITPALLFQRSVSSDRTPIPAQHRRPIPYRPIYPKHLLCLKPRRGGGPIHDPRRSLAVSLVLAAALCTRSAAAEIRIATAAPITGAYAWFGEQYQRGAGLAVADLNPKVGVHLSANIARGTATLASWRTTSPAPGTDGTSSCVCRLKRSVNLNPEGDRRHGWNDR